MIEPIKNVEVETMMILIKELKERKNSIDLVI